MGIPSSVKWYHILGFAIIVGTHDAYHYALRKSNDLYCHTLDTIASHTLTPTPMTDKALLYQTTSPRPPKPFPQFASLPAELRRHIWRLACEEPRTIEMRQRAEKHATGSLYSICRIPVPLHVCAESRAEALTFYERSFATADVLAEGNGMYVDFSRDTVYFGQRADFYGFLAGAKIRGVKGLDRVRNLAVKCSRVGDVRRWDFDVLGGLEVIVLVAQGRERFDLGREPTLVGVDQLGSRGYNTLARVTSAFEKKFEQLRRTKACIWIPPTIRSGMFVKGETDSWLVKSEGF